MCIGIIMKSNYSTAVYCNFTNSFASMYLSTKVTSPLRSLWPSPMGDRYRGVRLYYQRSSMTKIFHSSTTAIPLLGGATYTGTILFNAQLLPLSE